MCSSMQNILESQYALLCVANVLLMCSSMQNILESQYALLCVANVLLMCSSMQNILESQYALLCVANVLLMCSSMQNILESQCPSVVYLLCKVTDFFENFCLLQHTSQQCSGSGEGGGVGNGGGQEKEKSRGEGEAETKEVCLAGEEEEVKGGGARRGGRGLRVSRCGSRQEISPDMHGEEGGEGVEEAGGGVGRGGGEGAWENVCSSTVCFLESLRLLHSAEGWPKVSLALYIFYMHIYI
jgi:hypothetical protein